jgi:hypothetical protein
MRSLVDWLLYVCTGTTAHYLVAHGQLNEFRRHGGGTAMNITAEDLHYQRLACIAESTRHIMLRWVLCALQDQRMPSRNSLFESFARFAWGASKRLDFSSLNTRAHPQHPEAHDDCECTDHGAPEPQHVCRPRLREHPPPELDDDCGFYHSHAAVQPGEEAQLAAADGRSIINVCIIFLQKSHAASAARLLNKTSVSRHDNAEGDAAPWLWAAPPGTG